MIDTIISDLPFCIAYVDDILVFSSTTEEHWHHMHVVLERHRSAGHVLRRDKCVFGAKKINFLGYHITYKGIFPLQEKVAVVRAFQTPTTVEALQEFVGMVNYYHRFLPHIAATMAPLYAALTRKPKTLTWSLTLDEGPDEERHRDLIKSVGVFVLSTVQWMMWVIKPWGQGWDGDFFL